jgi:hypothetical protein
MGGVPSPVAGAAAGLQGTQLLYDEDLFSGPTPMKSEREGGVGTFGLPGGGDTTGGGYQGGFLGASISGEC